MVDLLVAQYAHSIANSAQPFNALAFDSPIAANEVGLSKFQAGDNINILSLGVSILSPFQLVSKDPATNVLKSNIPLACLIHYLSGGPSTPPFDSFVPFTPYELALGEYVDVGNNSQFQLYLQMTQLSSLFVLGSVAGVPASFDGQSIGISIFAKVEHTLQMVP